MATQFWFAAWCLLNLLWRALKTGFADSLFKLATGCKPPTPELEDFGPVLARHEGVDELRAKEFEVALQLVRVEIG